MAGTGIIIADRGGLFAQGVTQLLAEHGYEVLGVAATGAEALALAADHPDGLVLVDETLDDGGAPAFLRSLAAAGPGHPAIVLNGSWDLSEVATGLAAGAAGVIDKSCAPEHLFAAIDLVAAGGMVFSSEAVAVLRDRLTDVFALVAESDMRRLALAPREIDVLRLLSTSMTLQQMGAHLYVSRKTIQNNASSLYRKLDAGGRPEAVARAIELGLIAPASKGAGSAAAPLAGRYSPPR
jgi:DNA-binding NarL/FixJ family response regulator